MEVKTKQEEIIKVIDEVLSEELILKQFTKERCPPSADSVDCKLKPEIKHRRCMECWQEFVDKLNLSLRQRLHSHGAVLKVEKPFRIGECVNSDGVSAFVSLIEE